MLGGKACRFVPLLAALAVLLYMGRALWQLSPRQVHCIGSAVSGGDTQMESSTVARRMVDVGLMHGWLNDKRELQAVGHCPVPDLMRDIANGRNYHHLALCAALARAAVARSLLIRARLHAISRCKLLALTVRRRC